MVKRKVLSIVHNHPALFPGGAETYALELHRAICESERFESILLARIDTARTPARFGTSFSSASADGREYFFHTETSDFDFVHQTLRNKEQYTTHLHRFLQAHRPDVVHFQHTQFLGLEMIRQVRNTLGDVPILYTLHEYLPICHRDGQMLRTRSGERCMQETPRRCHECFPEISPQQFFLRKRFIQSQLELVDQFLAPSQFLLERYVEWGIPRAKIMLEEYGRRPMAPSAGEHLNGQVRDRFAFFGQLNEYKGVDVLLKAMALLESGQELQARPRLRIHGANLNLQRGEWQKEFRRLLDSAGDAVEFAGPYQRADLPPLMAQTDWVVVPSIWWENSPLVIQEAFAHGRPVICSEIGGMAEKVKAEVNGLHFRAGDANSLADALIRAASNNGLWDQLRKGIPPVNSMRDHIEKLGSIYQRLLEGKARTVCV